MNKIRENDNNTVYQLSKKDKKKDERRFEEAAKVEAEAKAGGGGAECEGARVRGGRARVCNPIRRRGCPAILCTCRAGATIRVEVTLCYGVEVTFIWETMAKVEASMWARDRKPSRFMMR